MMVYELQNEPYDPVLAYKPQDVKTPQYPSLPEDSFVLAIQTEWQKVLYEQFSSTILCVH